MKFKLVPLFLLLVVSTLSAQQKAFTGNWMAISGDITQAATIVISFEDSVFSLKFTWENGENWQARGYLVKGILVGGFAYSEKDGGFFTVALSGAHLFLNTYNTDLTTRTPKGITLRKTG